MAKKDKKESTEVATQETEVVVSGAPSSYGEMTGQGMENVTQADILVPFINLLQSDSPSVKDGTNKIGQYINSATKEVYDTFPFVACGTMEEYCVWKDRKIGGGLDDKWKPSDPRVKKASERQGKEKWLTPEGHNVQQTFYIFALEIRPDGEPPAPCILAFASTKINHYRAFIMKTQRFMIDENGKKVNPPLFAYTLDLTSFDDSRPAGEFKNVVISPSKGGSLLESLIPLDSTLMAEAIACSRLMNEGILKPDYETQTDHSSGDPSVDEEF